MQLPELGAKRISFHYELPGLRSSVTATVSRLKIASKFWEEDRTTESQTGVLGTKEEGTVKEEGKERPVSEVTAKCRG